MKCDRCGSERIMNVLGHCVDSFSAQYQGEGYDGYVPSDIGIGGGDDMDISYCLECGKIQGKFPLPDPCSFKEAN